MRLAFSLLLVLTLGSLACAGARGAAPTRPADLGALADDAATPLERALFADLADGRLDAFDLLEAGLVVSGVGDRASLAALHQAVVEVGEDPRVAAARTPRLRAEALFVALHERLLRRYDAAQSDLAVTLRTGVYNCVSATLLFNGLAERHGLDAVAVDLPSHVHTRLRFPGGADVDVETTHPAGFAPFRTEAAYRKFLEERGLAGAAPEGLAPRGFARPRPGEGKVVPSVVALSFVYANAATVALDRGDTEGAWTLFAKASRVAPGDATYRHNRDALLHNLALGHLQRGAPEPALRLVDFALAAAPDGPMNAQWRRLAAYAHGLLAERAVASGDVGALERALAEAKKVAPADPALRQNTAAWVQQMALKLAAEGQGRAGRALVLRHVRPGDAGEAGRALVGTYLQLAAEAAVADADAGRYDAAVAEVDRAVAELRGFAPDPEALSQLHGVAGLANFRARRFAAAAEACRRALALFEAEGTRKNLFASLASGATEAYRAKDCAAATRLAREALALADEPALRDIVRVCGP